MNKANCLIMEMRKLLFAASRHITFYHYTFFLLSVLAVNVTSRSLHDSAQELVLDGITNHNRQDESSVLRLKGMDSSDEYYCNEQMYGFLPCSSTLAGHLFLIVVYEYLLFKGESLVISGGSRLFEILGPGVFGASAFPVLDPLPESLIVLVSGLVSSKEEAQEYVITGVGLLAGSTIFLLTLLWGTCVIVGSQKFSSNTVKHRQSSLSGFGVTTDSETSETARIMLVSLIPLIVILIPKIFNVPYTSGGYKIDILITLIVSAILLLAYVYKISDEQVQVRRLQYVEVEHELLIFDIIQRLNEHISEPLVTKDGAPNELGVRSLFKKLDKNGDNKLSYLELKTLLEEIKLDQLTWDWEKVMDILIDEFDRDDDKGISYEEFHDGVTKWIEEIKGVLNEPNHSEALSKVARRLLEQKKRDEESMKNLTSELLILSHGSLPGNFPTDEELLRQIFESIDEDNDKLVSLTELRSKFRDFDLGDISLDEGDAAEKIMKRFDKNKDGKLDVEEFIAGYKQWHDLPINPAPSPLNESRQRIMKQVDKSQSARTRAVMLLVLGIAILVLLAEPLIHSVQKFSTSAGIPSFYIAFVLVPLATNARTTIAAIRAVSQKKILSIKETHSKETAASMIFSEIYHGALMNNILGMVVLTSIIYFRGLTWHFSSEVLAVLVVCVVMGFLASFRSKFLITYNGYTKPTGLDHTITWAPEPNKPQLSPIQHWPQPQT